MDFNFKHELTTPAKTQTWTTATDTSHSDGASKSSQWFKVTTLGCLIMRNNIRLPIWSHLYMHVGAPFWAIRRWWKAMKDNCPLVPTQYLTQRLDTSRAPNNFKFGDASEISDLFAGKPMVKHVKPMVNQPTLPASCPKIEVNGWYATGSCHSDETCRGIKCRVAGTQARFDPRGWEIPAPNGGLKGIFSWKDIRTGGGFGTFGYIWIIFPYMGNFIIPTDELHDFSEG